MVSQTPMHNPSNDPGPTDPLGSRRPYERDRGRSPWAWIIGAVVVVAAVVGLFFALGGDADVDVDGGDVDVQTPDIDADVDAPNVDADVDINDGEADADADADAGE